MAFSHRPPASSRGAGRTRRAPSRLRTYVLIAIDEWADAANFARPLGTIVAGTRTQARTAACALHADIAPADLRAVAASCAPAGYLARALARDGERLLRERLLGECLRGERTPDGRTRRGGTTPENAELKDAA